MIINTKLKHCNTDLYQKLLILIMNKSRNFISLDSCLYIAGTCLILLYLNYLCICENSIVLNEFLKMRNKLFYQSNTYHFIFYYSPVVFYEYMICNLHILSCIFI